MIIQEEPIQLIPNAKYTSRRKIAHQHINKFVYEAASAADLDGNVSAIIL